MLRFIGIILLCIFLLVTGILLITNITIAASGIILGLSAIGAAILLFVSLLRDRQTPPI